MAKGNKLTLKQEKFCQVYVETGNGSEAVRQAYPRSKNWNDASVAREAVKTQEKPNVAARINELRAHHAKRHEITIDSIVAEFEQDRRMAREKEDVSNAIKASQEIAKLNGLYEKDNKQKQANITIADAIRAAERGEDIE